MARPTTHEEEAAAPAGAQITVAVADAQPLYRDALARVIRQRVRLRLVAEYCDGRAALRGIEALRPDVAVLDADLPGLSGARVLGALTRDRLPVRAIVLFGRCRPGEGYDLFASGAAAYVSKDATADEIEAAILSAVRGHAVIAPSAQSDMAREIRLRARHQQAPLSAREQQILRLVAAGRSAPEIARELHLATATVKTHLLHLYEKLGVSDRAAAVAQAMRRGLLE